jgi:hypothetical protein
MDLIKNCSIRSIASLRSIPHLFPPPRRGGDERGGLNGLNDLNCLNQKDQDHSNNPILT